MYFDFAGPKQAGRAFFGGKYLDTDRGFLNQVNQPLHFMLISSLLFTTVTETLSALVYDCIRNYRAKNAFL